MKSNATLTEISPLVLHLGKFAQRLDDHEFFEFCQMNRDVPIERTSQGDLIIMSPTGGTTGKINFVLIGLFSAWVEQDGTGIGFDSSTGFTLPNGAKRSPDLSWVRKTRWEKLSTEEQAEFPPLCPDFVIELRSPSDAVIMLQEKIHEYLANGTQLGWLIDPVDKKVYIFRTTAEIICLDDPGVISGDPELRGFSLQTNRLWGG